MRVLGIASITIATLIVPGFAQIMGGSIALGGVLFSVSTAAFVLYGLVISPLPYYLSIAIGLLSWLSSAALFLRRRSVTLRPWMGVILFPVMFSLAGAAVMFSDATTQTFRNSGSMRPTIASGEYTSIRFVSSEDMRRGDIIVFRGPRTNGQMYAKRVVGLPGERIQMRRGVLHIDGMPVTRRKVADTMVDIGSSRKLGVTTYEEEFPEGSRHMIMEERGDKGIFDDTTEYVVPLRHFFVLGDNRDNSLDSRATPEMGPIPFENVRGRVFRISFPVPRPVDP